MPLSRPAIRRRARGTRSARRMPRRGELQSGALRPSTNWLNAVGQPQHLGPDRMPLLLVAVQQTVAGDAVDGGRQFPAEVHRVLDAGVHALAAERRVHVRGVARQENAAHAVAAGLPPLAEKPGTPPRSVMPKSVPAMPANDSRISVMVTGTSSARSSRCRSHAIARNQPSPNGTMSTTPSALVLANMASAGGSVSRTSASAMCVGYCLPTKSTPEQVAHRAVRAVAAHDVAGAQVLAPAVDSVTPLGVLAQVHHVGAADHLDAQFAGPRLQQVFGAALRRDQQHA